MSNNGSVIKQRMDELKVSQVDMILRLQERNIVVQPPMLSSILRGVYTYPKAMEILSICSEILDNYERDVI